MTQGPDPKYEFNPYAPPTFTSYVVPRQADGDPSIAARGTRLAARLIDYALFGATLVPMVIPLFFMKGHVAVIVASILPLLCILTYQCYLVTMTGQSLAKKWLDLKIVRLDGSPVGFVAGVLVREWVFLVFEIIPFVGLLVRLADAAMIFGEDRRCVHDYLCGTKVIGVPSASLTKWSGA